MHPCSNSFQALITGQRKGAVIKSPDMGSGLQDKVMQVAGHTRTLLALLVPSVIATILYYPYFQCRRCYTATTHMLISTTHVSFAIYKSQSALFGKSDKLFPSFKRSFLPI